MINKVTKKFITIVCMVVLACSLPTLAFAAPSPSNPAPAAPPGSSALTFEDSAEDVDEDTDAMVEEEQRPTEVAEANTPSSPVVEVPSPADTPDKVSEPVTPTAPAESPIPWVLIVAIVAAAALILFSVLIIKSVAGRSKKQ